LTPFLVCIGIHLAYMELRLTFVTFFRALPAAVIAPETTDEEMEMEDYFLIAPKAHRCLITVKN
jgi:cytochrome P450